MKTIPLTKGYEAIVDDADYEALSKWKWHVSIQSGKPYARRSVWDQKRKRAIGIPMHRCIMNPPKNMQVDHINGNPLDNRRENLRCCTLAENTRNRRSHKGSTSRYLGVSWDACQQLWVANIQKRHIGSFNDEKLAAKKYDAEATKTFGSFANLNFPLSQLLP